MRPLHTAHHSTFTLLTIQPSYCSPFNLHTAHHSTFTLLTIQPSHCSPFNLHTAHHSTTHPKLNRILSMDLTCFSQNQDDSFFTAMALGLTGCSLLHLGVSYRKQLHMPHPAISSHSQPHSCNHSKFQWSRLHTLYDRCLSYS